MEYLNDEQTTKSIIDYLEENTYNYAVLINGEWGVGKTYFIKNILQPNIKKHFEEKNINKDIIYLSLYGLTDIEKLSSQIYVQIAYCNRILKRIGNISEKPFIGGLAGVATDLFDKPKLSPSSIMQLFGESFDPKSCIFIFDDLERCFIGINDILGFINKFMEQCSVKTIIIANEKEIGESFLHQNSELKQLVAINANEIFQSQEKSEKKNKRRGSSHNIQLDDKMTIVDLKKRTERLFREDIYYEKIKEKLIGRTLNYRPDFSKVIQSIFNIVFSKEYNQRFANLLIKNTKDICEKENYFNLRTILFAFNFIKKIYEIINDDNFNENDCIVDVKEDIIKNIINTAIMYKSRGKKVTNDMNSILFNALKRNVSFEFVDDYIYRGVFNQTNILSEIDARYKEKVDIKIFPNDPVNRLNDFYLLEDDEIKNIYNELIENFEKGLYSINKFTSILGIIFNLNDIGYDTNVEDIFDKMLLFISSSDEKIDLSSYDRHLGLNRVRIMKAESQNLYNEYVNKLYKKIEKIKNKDKSDELNKFLIAEKDWGKKFAYYCHEKYNSNIVNREFFAMICMNNLLKCINISSNHDLIYFRNGISEVYQFSNIGEFYNNDYNSIHEFYEIIINLVNDETKKIRKHNLNLIKIQLESILERLKPKKEIEEINNDDLSTN